MSSAAQKKTDHVNDEIFAQVGVTQKNTETLRLDQLMVDSHYQRPVRDSRVNLFARNFDPVCCGPLTVSRRSSGKLYVIDGNHRRNVLQKVGISEWPCVVVEKLTSSQEAELFDRLNTDRSNATSAERFKARLHYKDPIATTIKSVVEGCGFVLILENYSSRRDGRTIHAVSSLDLIFRRSNQPGLKNTLDMIASCWDREDPGATDSITLKGIHLVLHHRLWKGKVNKKHLRERLSRIPVTKLLRKARGYHETQGGDMVSLFADAVVLENNKRIPKKSGKWLPPRGMEAD